MKDAKLIFQIDIFLCTHIYIFGTMEERLLHTPKVRGLYLILIYLQIKLLIFIQNTQ